MEIHVSAVSPATVACSVSAAFSGTSVPLRINPEVSMTTLVDGSEPILGDIPVLRFLITTLAPPSAPATGGKKAKKAKKGKAPVAVIAAADDELLELLDALSRAATAEERDVALSGVEARVSARGADVDAVSSAVAGALLFAGLDGTALGGRPALAALVAAAAANTAVSESVAAARDIARRLDNAVPSTQEQVQRLLRAAVRRAFPRAEALGVNVAGLIAAPNTTGKKTTHHYQCATAMEVFATLGRAKAPETPASREETAAAIAAAVPSNDIIGAVHVNRGFLEVSLAAGWLSERATSVFRTGQRAPLVTPRVVGIDYSSPNIAKDMHVGHLRSTIIGDTLARTLEFLGHTVHRINHVGDWGTQFGMLIANLKDKAPDCATNPPPMTDLTSMYKDAKRRFDEDADFNRRAHEEVVKLQAGDAENVAIWKAICAASEELFRSVYSRLGVSERLEVVGESFYNDKAAPLLQRLEATGVVEDDGGAKVLRVPGQKVPLILRKRDGGIGYDTTDLSALHYRTSALGCDWLVYVVDHGQSLHFELLFAGARRAGLIDDAVRTDHVGFGVVKGEDGQRLKTRSGETVRLVDLLDEARARMQAQLQERADKGLCHLAPEDIEATATGMGYAGVKYFDLRQNRQSDYVFNYDRMLSPDGDTAVYVQYAHARICSIARKAGTTPEELRASGAAAEVREPAEVALAAELARFQEIVESSANELVPHHVVNYAYKLCGRFSEFYQKCKVVGHEHQQSRLVLCEATAMTIRKVLSLLAIEPVHRI